MRGPCEGPARRDQGALRATWNWATPSQVLSFGSDNDLFAVTMPWKWALSLSLPQELRKRGVFVYAHTVNSLDVWRELRDVGVSGIYTDFLIPAEIARVVAAER